MNKISIVLFTVLLLACHGNETAENEPTDLDRTKNNDTSAVPINNVTALPMDSTDSAHLNK